MSGSISSLWEASASRLSRGGTRRLIFALTVAAAGVLFCSPARAITFADWIASHGLSGADAAAAADPDKDGIPNLLEFAIADCSPTVMDAGRSTLPRIVFFRRTGAGLANVVMSETINRTGINGVWHAGLAWTPRADAEGIRYRPQLGDRDTLQRWFFGPAVFRLTTSGTERRAMCIVQSQRQHRQFLRLQIVLQ